MGLFDTLYIPAPWIYPEALLPIKYEMKTIAEMSALPQEEKDRLLRAAKGGTWYDGWVPYCGTYSTINRMIRHDHGFNCTICGNIIGWDLLRLKESRLNRYSGA